MDFFHSWIALDNSISIFMRQYHDFGIGTENAANFSGKAPVNLCNLARFNEYNNITLDETKNKQHQ